MSSAVRSHRRLHRIFGWALLAWFALALSPLATASATGIPMTAATAHAMHHGGSMHDTGCCADAGQPPHAGSMHGCSCAMLCTVLLPTAALTVAAAAPGSGTLAPPSLLDAPLSGFAPPLRPPLG